MVVGGGGNFSTLERMGEVVVGLVAVMMSDRRTGAWGDCSMVYSACS